MCIRDRMYTPYKCKKQGENTTLVYSDHCSISTSINILKGSGKTKRKVEKRKIWVIEDDGLNKFGEISKNDAELGDMSNNNRLSFGKGPIQNKQKLFIKTIACTNIN